MKHRVYTAVTVALQSREEEIRVASYSRLGAWGVVFYFPGRVPAPVWKFNTKFDTSEHHLTLVVEA